MSEQPPLPLITNDPVEVSQDIYVIPDGGVPLVPNVGIVAGARAALVVDTGMGPASGNTVRRHAEALAGGRRLYLTITHFHPEHGFGAQSFTRDATIVYNIDQLQELQQKGQSYLEMFRTFGETVAQQLEAVELLEPHVVYERSAEMLLGGLHAQLRAVGRAHTGADEIVFVPERRVLFTGDLVESASFAIFPWFPPDDADVDGERWIAVLEELERLEPEVVVPGHGPVGDAGLISTAREYLQLLRCETRRLARSGATEDEAAAELDRAMRRLHPDWAQPEWIASGARCFYAAYRRESGSQ